MFKKIDNMLERLWTSVTFQDCDSIWVTRLIVLFYGISAVLHTWTLCRAIPTFIEFPKDLFFQATYMITATIIAIAIFIVATIHHFKLCKEACK